MSYYPSPNPVQDYTVAYYSPHPHFTSGQNNYPAPFPTDQFGQYGPPGSPLPPGLEQHPPYGPYPLPGFEPQSPPALYHTSGFGPQYLRESPIREQPPKSITEQWMSPSPSIPNCPPGLEYLIPLSNLFVKQKVEYLEALTGFETENKYTIRNDKGEKIYWVAENSDVCSRMCYGRLRPYEMTIIDIRRTVVLRLRRPLRCVYCCFPCCLQLMEVYSPEGQLMGTIEQQWSLVYPKFRIKDERGEVVFKIEGPFCGLSFCGQADFPVLSRDEKVKVGRISKEWSGFARELFTDADFFGISFPRDLDVRMKAVMIGAMLLIDIMFFEK